MVLSIRDPRDTLISMWHLLAKRDPKTAPLLLQHPSNFSSLPEFDQFFDQWWRKDFGLLEHFVLQCMSLGERCLMLIYEERVLHRRQVLWNLSVFLELPRMSEETMSQMLVQTFVVYKVQSLARVNPDEVI